MVSQIPIEIRKITDPDGTTRIGAIAFLDGVLSTPDIKNRLAYVEKQYLLLLMQCESILARTKTPEGRPDAKLRWLLAQKVSSFLNATAKDLCIILINYTEALERDLGLSQSELRYIFKFFKKYRDSNELDPRINWSKYRELMDFSDEKIRKQCEAFIKEGKIKSDGEIRAFKKKMQISRNL